MGRGHPGHSLGRNTAFVVGEFCVQDYWCASIYVKLPTMLLECTFNNTVRSVVREMIRGSKAQATANGRQATVGELLRGDRRMGRSRLKCFQMNG